MVVRTYPIRVENPKGGTSGPMSMEIDWETISERSQIPVEILKENEKGSVSQKLRRVSEFDWKLLADSAALNSPTDVALTFADYHAEQNKDAMRFEQLSSDTTRFIEEIEKVSGAPVSLIATGFNSRSVIDRRKW